MKMVTTAVILQSVLIRMMVTSVDVARDTMEMAGLALVIIDTEFYMQCNIFPINRQE